MRTTFTLIIVLIFISCKPDTLPEPSVADATTPLSAFGIDGLNRTYIDDMALLGDGISGLNGISWGDIEPNKPENGIHDYRLANEMMQLNATLKANNRALQLNFRLASSWALDRDPERQVTNPENGSMEDGILRVSPSHEQDLEAIISYILTNLDVSALQIGSEAENEWLDAAAYVHALSIIYRTAKELQPTITIMAFGFNPANYFTQPEQFDQQLINEKLTFVESVIQNGHPWFDVFSFHALREYEAIAPTVAWVNDQMQAHGYTKPIWVDDMYSGP